MERDYVIEFVDVNYDVLGYLAFDAHSGGYPYISNPPDYSAYMKYDDAVKQVDFAMRDITSKAYKMYEPVKIIRIMKREFIMKTGYSVATYEADKKRAAAQKILDDIERLRSEYAELTGTDAE